MIEFKGFFIGLGFIVFFVLLAALVNHLRKRTTNSPFEWNYQEISYSIYLLY